MLFGVFRNWGLSSEKFDEWIENIESANGITVSETAKMHLTKNIIAGNYRDIKEYELQYIGRIFKCRGEGVSCRLYKMASSGLGDASFCKGRTCQFDPYTEKHKRDWYGEKSAKWRYGISIFNFWKNIIESGQPVEVRADALRRLGSIKIPRVKDILIKYSTRKVPEELQEVAISALVNFQQ